MADWFYVAAGEPAGPVDEAALKRLFEDGALPRETQVWQAGMEDWLPATEVAAFAKPVSPVYVITPVIPKKPPAKTPAVPSPPAPAVPGGTPAVAPGPASPALPSSQAGFFPPLPGLTAAAVPKRSSNFPRLPLVVPRWIKIAGVFVAAAVLYSCLALPWHLAAAFNYVRGQKAEDRKDYAAAAAYYQASLKECPLSPVVLGRLGVVSIYQGDEHTLDWVNGELPKSGAADDGDVNRARAAMAEALQSGKR